jgi:uncharacterized delta-60 repeat protein
MNVNFSVIYLSIIFITSCAQNEEKINDLFKNPQDEVRVIGAQVYNLEYNFSPDHIDNDPPGYTTKDEAVAVEILPDESILVAGNMAIPDNGNESRDVYIAKFTPEGELDTNFADNGYYKFDRDNFDGAGDIVYSGGAIYLVFESRSNATSDSSQLAVTKMDTDGTIDTDFGTAGTLYIDVGDKKADAKRAFAASDGIYALAVGGINATSKRNTFIYKILSTGSLDSTFAGDGELKLAVESDTQFSFGVYDTIKTDSAGNIFVGGTRWNGTSSRYDAYVAKIQANGTVDTTFADNGYYFRGTTTYDYLEDFVISQNYLYLPIPRWKNDFSGYITHLIRLDVNTGAVDTSFNNGSGEVVFDGYYYGRSDILDNKILLSGAIINPSDAAEWSHSYIKLNLDGSVDTPYGTNGVFERKEYSKLNSIRDLRVSSEGYSVGVGHMLNEELNDQVIFIQKLSF